MIKSSGTETGGTPQLTGCPGCSAPGVPSRNLADGWLRVSAVPSTTSVSWDNKQVISG